MATTTTTQSTSLPPWLESSYQDLLARAGQVSQQGYQPYVDANGNPIPRTAGFTQDQLDAMARVRANQGVGQGDFNNAGNLISSAGNFSSTGAANPYFQNAASGSGYAAAQPGIDMALKLSALGAARDNLNAASDMRVTDAAAPWLTRGVNTDAAAAASPYVQQGINANSAGAAAPYVQQGISTNSLGVANPLVSKGTGSWTQNASAYMSPYTSAVTDRIAQLGARNLSENLLPAVNKTFIGSGQFGGSRNAEFTNRALRDTQESVLGQQSNALESGYKTAADIYNQDAARALQGGLGLGNLAEAGASRAIQGGLGLGNLTGADASRAIQGGLGLGNLTSENANRAIQAGSTMGNLASADANRLAQIGATIGNLTEADQRNAMQAAQLSGQLRNADLDRQLSIGNSVGNLANTDAARALQAGNALSSLGTARQTAGYTDANALSGIGAAQQALNQTGLNTAYGDFQNQRDWNKNNLSWLSGILSGSAKPTTTTTTQPGQSQTSQVLGGLTSGLGLLGATGAFGSDGWLSSLFAEGGRVKLAEGGLARYADGGMVDYSSMPQDELEAAAASGDMRARWEAQKRMDNARFRSALTPDPKAIGRMLSTVAPNVFKVAQTEPDYGQFSGAYPLMDEIGPSQGGGDAPLSAPIPARKPMGGLDRDPYMAMTPQQQVRQDIDEEVGLSPGPSVGPAPMGGLSAFPAAPNAPIPGVKPEPPPESGGFDWGSSNPLWTALAAAGAGAMSSKSPTALGGIGEGLSAGLNAVAQQKKLDQQQAILDRQADADAERLGLEGRRVDVAERREQREAASDLLDRATGSDKNQPAQAKMIQFLMSGGMSREEATDRVFGAKTDPLDRAKLVGTLSKIYQESGDAQSADEAIQKAKAAVEQLAPTKKAAPSGASGKTGIQIGQRATNGGKVLEWNGRAWVPVGP